MFKYVVAFVLCLFIMLLLQQGCDKMRSRRWDHRKEQQEHREQRRDELWDRRHNDDRVPPFNGIFRRRARSEDDEASLENDSLVCIG